MIRSPCSPSNFLFSATPGPTLQYAAPLTHPQTFREANTGRPGSLMCELGETMHMACSHGLRSSPGTRKRVI
jgi:hypothetical protein